MKDLNQNTQTQQVETPEQEIARLRQENEALKANADKGHGLKVSEKGAVSLYGMGRFPVTLYAPQWIEILTVRCPEILAFIERNRSKLQWEKPKDKAKTEVKTTAQIEEQPSARAAFVDSKVNVQ
jgi:hypothetical protein